MGTLTIRNLDDPLKSRLRLRAAARNRSMEEEARTLLRSALQDDVNLTGNLPDAIRARFRRFGGVGLRIPAREAIRDPPRSGR